MASLPTTEHFTDSAGNPQPVSGFAATAKAHFAAQVIRNGVVVEDDDEVILDPKELHQ